jgi:hypothetical protein
MHRNRKEQQNESIACEAHDKRSNETKASFESVEKMKKDKAVLADVEFLKYS